jgi:polysaccharide export outer membrane protein
MFKFLTIFIALVPAALLSAAEATLTAPLVRYHLQTSDRLELQYRYTPELNQTVDVQPDGFVSLNLAGDLHVAGMTLEDAKAAILTRVRVRLNEPELNVSLEEYVKPAFVVAGQVGNPGRYEMHGDVTALEAISIAGGFKDSAKHSQILLFRHISPDMAETKILNLKEMMNPGHPTLELIGRLQPGDLLVVPQNRVSKMERYIHWANVGMFLNPAAF